MTKLSTTLTRVRLDFVTIQNRILKLTQQNRVTPSPSLLSFEFRLGLLTWTLDSDLLGLGLGL